MTIQEITPQAAETSLDEFHVVDVREPHEFLGPLGFIAGAELVPLGNIEESAPRLSNGRTLLLVCRSGKRSARACEVLQKAGVDDVANLAGGMIAWNREGLPALRAEIGSLEALLDALVAWLAQISGSTRDSAGSRIGALLEAAGGSPADPTHAAIEQTLAALETGLQRNGAPPDLDLTLAAFRRDLAVL